MDYETFVWNVMGTLRATPGSVRSACILCPRNVGARVASGVCGVGRRDGPQGARDALGACDGVVVDGDGLRHARPSAGRTKSYGS